MSPPGSQEGHLKTTVSNVSSYHLAVAPSLVEAAVEPAALLAPQLLQLRPQLEQLAGGGGVGGGGAGGGGGGGAGGGGGGAV